MYVCMFISTELRIKIPSFNVKWESFATGICLQTSSANVN